MDRTKIFVINHNNKERGNRMISRLNKLGISDKVEIIAGLDTCMDSHMDCIKKFIEAEDKDKDYLVVMEDDIYLHKDFSFYLEYLAEQIETLDLEIVLLSYLLGILPKNDPERFPHLYSDEKISLYDYQRDLWGTQCYMMTYKYAQFLYDNLTEEYARTHCKHYSSDWTITKISKKKALMIPMLGIEECEIKGEDYGQNYLRRCLMDWHYHPETYY